MIRRLHAVGFEQSMSHSDNTAGSLSRNSLPKTLGSSSPYGLDCWFDDGCVLTRGVRSVLLV
jgi:hypothetical protein